MLKKLPVLESDRVRLRPFVESDIEPLDALYMDPEVMRFLPTSKGLPDAAKHIRLFHERFEERGYSLWAAEAKDGREFIGRIGLWPLDGTDEVELAYILGKPFWGKGIATEASALCLDFAFEQLGLGHVAAVAVPENGASLRVMEKLGFTFVREGRFYGLVARYHRLGRDEWRNGGGHSR